MAVYFILFVLPARDDESMNVQYSWIYACMRDAPHNNHMSVWKVLPQRNRAAFRIHGATLLLHVTYAINSCRAALHKMWQCSCVNGVTHTTLIDGSWLKYKACLEHGNRDRERDKMIDRCVCVRVHVIGQPERVYRVWLLILCICAERQEHVYRIAELTIASVVRCDGYRT